MKFTQKIVNACDAVAAVYVKNWPYYADDEVGVSEICEDVVLAHDDAVNALVSRQVAGAQSLHEAISRGTLDYSRIERDPNPTDDVDGDIVAHLIDMFAQAVLGGLYK